MLDAEIVDVLLIANVITEDQARTMRQDIDRRALEALRGAVPVGLVDEVLGRQT